MCASLFLLVASFSPGLAACLSESRVDDADYNIQSRVIYFVWRGISSGRMCIVYGEEPNFGYDGGKLMCEDTEEEEEEDSHIFIEL